MKNVLPHHTRRQPVRLTAKPQLVHTACGGIRYVGGHQEMKTVLIGIALWLSLVSCSTKNEKTDDHTVALKEASWTDIDYHQAKAYVTRTPYLLGEIVANGKLVPQAWDTAGVNLTGQQVLRLKQILTQPDKDGDYAVSDCFYPRHGIVLWDKANKPVAHLSVCFECNQLKAKPQVDKLDLREIKELFVELGVPVFEDPIQHEQYFKTVNRKDAR